MRSNAAALALPRFRFDHKEDCTAHPPAVDQNEANAIATIFEPRCDYLQVHWVSGFRGRHLALIQPVVLGAEEPLH